MKIPTLQVMDDKQHALLDVRGEYDALEIEGLIAELSALRASMSPVVPSTPPVGHCPEDAAASRAGGDPCVQVAVMRDGLTRFWVRHAGLGWFGFNLPADRASTLANYILGLTVGGGRVPDHDAFRARRRKADLSH